MPRRADRCRAPRAFLASWRRARRQDSRRRSRTSRDRANTAPRARVRRAERLQLLRPTMRAGAREARRRKLMDRRIAFGAALAVAGAATPATAQGILNGAGGAERSSQFGAAIAALSDVDGDGVADLVVGAPLEDAGLADRGVVRVFSGANGAVKRSLLGPAANARFGASVAGVGDVTGDGVPDFVVAAPGASIVSSRSGA